MNTQTEYTLISHHLCPYVQRSVIALEEKRIPYERVNIDLANKPDWFNDISPSGKVWTIWGFYLEEEHDAYGEGGWRVRFAPEELGEWEYSLQVRNAYGTKTCSLKCSYGVCENAGAIAKDV